MIYISYNQDDRTSVLYFVQKLKLSDLEIWIDTEKLKAGDLIDESISNGLLLSNCIIICLGKSLISDWQKNEIETAVQVHKKSPGKFRLIPIVLPGGTPDLIPEMLKQYLFLDFRNGFDDALQWKQLTAALKGDAIPQNILEIPTKQKDFPDKQKNIKAVSIAVIFQNQILLVKRGNQQKTGAGLWQLPGGKVSENEDSINAAVRELEEEVGIITSNNHLHHIVDLVDTWIKGGTSDFITMGIYYLNVKDKSYLLAPEFQEASWLNISDLFTNSRRIYFGSTSRYLKMLRRYFLIHRPLKVISEIINNNQQDALNLPAQIEGFTLETTQVIYGMLSLLGFLDDKSNFTSSSQLSGNLIKIFSEWALTEGAIFETAGSSNWYEQIEKKGDVEAVERYRAGLFDQHKNLLGLLSYRLPKALSTRNVCDLLITGYNESKNKKYVLVRWDFLALKFQIPAKGLENIDFELNSSDAAKYVVKERFCDELIPKFEYKYIGRLKTSHVGAGSLKDGPIMRNFIISVFKVKPQSKENNNVLSLLNQINDKTLNILKGTDTLEEVQKRNLNYYVWAEVNILEEKKTYLLGKKLQGYDEISNNFGIDVFNQTDFSININESNQLPVIEYNKIENEEQLPYILKEY